MDIADLDEWQHAVYQAILEQGPLTVSQIVEATILPAREVGRVLAQLEQARLILRRDDGWYAP